MSSRIITRSWRSGERLVPGTGHRETEARRNRREIPLGLGGGLCRDGTRSGSREPRGDGGARRRPTCRQKRGRWSTWKSRRCKNDRHQCSASIRIPGGMGLSQKNEERSLVGLRCGLCRDDTKSGSGEPRWGRKAKTHLRQKRGRWGTRKGRDRKSGRSKQRPYNRSR